MDNKIRLLVKGIVGSEDMKDAYILTLGEYKGTKMFPVVINAHEARSIVFFLEKDSAQRPFAHDLFCKLGKNYGIDVLEVFIHKFENNVFHTNIVCFDGEKQITLDSKISDAVAIAIRCGCPIFTTEKVIETGINIISDKNIATLSLKELHVKLNEVVQNDDYEMAIIIRDEIKRREK